jgi:hypothetical protein
VYHAGESDAVVAVAVELIGQSVLLVSVDVNVSFGGKPHTLQPKHPKP